ncbi:hypothetical protein [Wohlfahrtiimonas larvae]|uniref:Arginase n=1 Tax=Wohlfahrtiimonas larvae TaxID=1157986 RepID=A0ABP9N065_9GAMM|nr:hypothetical protein [Wohlfahrtiimonas larvae]
MAESLVLNFDNSVTIQSVQSINLTALQEQIRFGCSMKKWDALTSFLDQNMPDEYHTVLMGSGDYHHLSYYLINRLSQKAQKPFQVVVLDNHPDNMRFPFGIHCGSWISYVANLPWVSHIHVVGITSSDVTVKHSWETRLKPLYQKKLTNWCIGVDTSWANTIGLMDSFRSFETKESMMTALTTELQSTSLDAYLSIDKDVFAPEVVQTNWDQGILLEDDVMGIIDILQPNLIGSDITGEVSIYEYQAWWKRFLSGLDQQVAISQVDIVTWQQQQNQLNERLLIKINTD